MTKGIVSATSGVYMGSMWGHNLAGAVQGAITEYGGNGSVLGDLPQDATTTHDVGSSDDGGPGALPLGGGLHAGE